MGTRRRPARFRQHAGVRQQQARQARRAASAGTGDGRPGRYRWPADSREILAVTLDAGRAWASPDPAARRGRRQRGVIV
jgi:hypothetical protein